MTGGPESKCVREGVCVWGPVGLGKVGWCGGGRAVGGGGGGRGCGGKILFLR